MAVRNKVTRPCPADYRTGRALNVGLAVNPGPTEEISAIFRNGILLSHHWK